MKDLLDSIRSPAWWFSVIIAGLLVNLAAAYLKPLVDRVLAARFAARRRRLENESAAFGREVEEWAKRADGPVILRLEKLEHIHEQHVMLLWTIVIVLWSFRISAIGEHESSSLFSIASSIASLIGIIAALLRQNRAARTARVLDGVEEIARRQSRPSSEVKRDV